MINLAKTIWFISMFLTHLKPVQAASVALALQDNDLISYIDKNRSKNINDNKSVSSGILKKMLIQYIQMNVDESFLIEFKKPECKTKKSRGGKPYEDIIDQGFTNYNGSSIVFDYDTPGIITSQLRDIHQDKKNLITFVVERFNPMMALRFFGLDKFPTLSEERENILELEHSLGKMVKKDKSLKKLILEYEDKIKKILFVEYKKTLPTHIALPFSWLVFGCPLSTDIDIALIVPEGFVDKIKSGEITVDVTTVLLELVLLGYDIKNRELDFCYIELADDVYVKTYVRISSKGVQCFNTSMIHHTFPEHKQIYHECPVTKTDLDIGDLYKPLFSYCSKNVESEINRLCNIASGSPKWSAYRTLKKKSFGRIEVFLSLMSFLIKTDSVDILNGLTPDTKKSFMMKILQVLINEYIDDIPSEKHCLFFQKASMPYLFNECYKKEGISIDPLELLGWLSRGKTGKPLTMETFKLLIKLIDIKFNKNQLVFNEADVLYSDLSKHVQISTKISPRFVLDALKQSGRMPRNTLQYVETPLIKDLFNKEFGIRYEELKHMNSPLIESLIELIRFDIRSFSSELYDAMTLYKTGIHSEKPTLCGDLLIDLKKVYHLLYGQICEEVFRNLLRDGLDKKNGPIYEAFLKTIFSTSDNIKQVIDLTLLDIVFICNEVTGNAPDCVCHLKYVKSGAIMEELFVIECKSKKEKDIVFDPNTKENQRSINLAKKQTGNFIGIVGEVGIPCQAVLAIFTPSLNGINVGFSLLP